MQVENPDFARHLHPAKDLPQDLRLLNGEASRRHHAHHHHDRQYDARHPARTRTHPETEVVGHHHQHHTGEEISPQPEVARLHQAAHARLDPAQLTRTGKRPRRRQIAKKSQVDGV